MNNAILANLYLANIRRWTDRHAALLTALDGLEACAKMDDRSIPEVSKAQLKTIAEAGKAFLKAVDGMKDRL